jgi:hypothetical protein
VTIRGIAAVLLAGALAVSVGACSPGATPTPAPTAAPTDSPAPSDTGSAAPAASSAPDSPVAGVVTAVDTDAAGNVKGFTLKTNDGDTITFVLGQLDNTSDFPASSLQDHETSATPIFVFFNSQNGQLVVYHLEDAP